MTTFKRVDPKFTDGERRLEIRRGTSIGWPRYDDPGPIKAKNQKRRWSSVGGAQGYSFGHEKVFNALLCMFAPKMFHMLNTVGEAIQKVEDNWERGDLAGAVRELIEVKPEIQKILDQSQDPTPYYIVGK